MRFVPVHPVCVSPRHEDLHGRPALRGVPVNPVPAPPADSPRGLCARPEQRAASRAAVPTSSRGRARALPSPSSPSRLRLSAHVTPPAVSARVAGAERCGPRARRAPGRGRGGRGGRVGSGRAGPGRAGRWARGSGHAEERALQRGPRAAPGRAGAQGGHEARLPEQARGRGEPLAREVVRALPECAVLLRGRAERPPGRALPAGGLQLRARARAPQGHRGRRGRARPAGQAGTAWGPSGRDRAGVAVQDRAGRLRLPPVRGARPGFLPVLSGPFSFSARSQGGIARGDGGDTCWTSIGKTQGTYLEKFGLAPRLGGARRCLYLR